MKLSTILLRKGNKYKQIRNYLTNYNEYNCCALGLLNKEIINAYDPNKNIQYKRFLEELLKVMTKKDIITAAQKMYDDNHNIKTVIIEDLPGAMYVIRNHIMWFNDHDKMSFKEIALKLKSYGL